MGEEEEEWKHALLKERELERKKWKASIDVSSSLGHVGTFEQISSSFVDETPCIDEEDVFSHAGGGFDSP